MSRLFLFTNFFPFEKSEPFLVNEFEYTKTKFDNIDLFALYGHTPNLKNTSQITVNNTVFKSTTSKINLLLKGVFCFSPCHIHIAEFFKKKIYLSAKKSYWFFVNLLVARSIMASKSFKKIKQAIASNEPALFYFYWGDNFTSIIPYLKVNTSNTKIIIRLHGSDLYEETKANYAPLRELIFKNAHKLYTVSCFGQKYLTEKYPEYTSKIIVSRLGVSFVNQKKELALNKAENYTIVSVSNVVALKRVDKIFEIINRLPLNITWHHFGGGALLSNLKKKTVNKCENVNIIFHGHVENKELIAFYNNNYVDVFINYSTTEGVPVSIMEAFMFGIPVFATNVGGVGELVNENNGVLLNKNTTVEEASSKLKSFLQTSKSQEIIKLRANAQYTYQQCCNAQVNYTNFYENIGE
ncbi:MAG: glycosyltransferase [Bacteroidetes bacterium]|nr:glycosyltransferase [Bacteroidota bacterium]